MSDTYIYPAEIERDEDGRYVVAFPDFGWGATDGATRDEALAEARDLLRELIAVTIREGEDLPEPSRATALAPNATTVEAIEAARRGEAVELGTPAEALAELNRDD